MPAQKFFAGIRTALEHRCVPVVLAVLAAVIMLPALNGGFIQDDSFHRVRLVDPSQLPERLRNSGLITQDSGTAWAAMRDMHSIARSQSDVENLKDFGIFPWWTAADFRGANWRPLDSFTHWLDYRLFSDSPKPMHLHNVIWFAAVVFLVSILYRRLMRPVWIASLAALLYVIDDSNYFPAMWIANRNLLLSLFFSVLTLLMHHRWRQHQSLAAGIAAPFLLVLSLLSTEAGIATSAYLFAYALAIDRGTWVRKALSLAPSFVVIVIWRVIYNALGYGAHGSGFVIDPGREPLRYAGAVLIRAPVLLFGQWGWQPAETFNFFPDYAKRWGMLIAGTFLVVLLIMFLSLLRRNRVALFWFLGMLLCVLPICATSPMNRNLLFVAIGAFGLTAQFIGGLVGKESWVPKSHVWRISVWILCAALLFIHVIMAGAARFAAPRMLSSVFETFYSTVAIGSPPSLVKKTVVAVNASNPFLFVGLPVFRAYQNEPLPKATRVLAPGFAPVEITRTGEKTLQLKAQTGNLLETDRSRKDLKPNFVYFYDHFNDLFRAEDMPFQIGERAELSGMSVEVVDVDGDGQPTQVSFSFDVSLDDPSLYWLQWNWKRGGFGSYSRFKVPAVGKKCFIQGPF